ncbi:hypothetical protein Ancab_005633 [Ancistrocladus abbreviatus]
MPLSSSSFLTYVKRNFNKTLRSNAKAWQMTMALLDALPLVTASNFAVPQAWWFPITIWPSLARVTAITSTLEAQSLPSKCSLLVALYLYALGFHEWFTKHP